MNFVAHKPHTISSKSHLKFQLLTNQLMFIKETKRDIITSLWWYGTLSGIEQRLSHSLVNKHNHWKLATVITLFWSVKVRYLKNPLRLEHLIPYKIYLTHKKVLSLKLKKKSSSEIGHNFQWIKKILETLTCKLHSLLVVL